MLVLLNPTLIFAKFNLLPNAFVCKALWFIVWICCFKFAHWQQKYKQSFGVQYIWYQKGIQMHHPEWQMGTNHNLKKSEWLIFQNCYENQK